MTRVGCPLSPVPAPLRGCAIKPSFPDTHGMRPRGRVLDNLAFPWQPAMMSAPCDDRKGPGEWRALQERGGRGGWDGGGRARRGPELWDSSLGDVFLGWLMNSTDQRPFYRLLPPPAPIPLYIPPVFHPPAAKQPRPAALAQHWLKLPTIFSPNHLLSRSRAFAGLIPPSLLRSPFPCHFSPHFVATAALLPVANSLPAGDPLYNSKIIKTSGRQVCAALTVGICRHGAVRRLSRSSVRLSVRASCGQSHLILQCITSGHRAAVEPYVGFSSLMLPG